ncbi:hypothetical protein HMPREF9069_01218 [Atopobium sp. oral taxon 810 str. F0209]|nr:hypothetical protein HMPREF9069_01218 [Atopobium sp. oral taxon 810 str. F0209]
MLVTKLTFSCKQSCNCSCITRQSSSNISTDKNRKSVAQKYS